MTLVLKAWKGRWAVSSWLCNPVSAFEPYGQLDKPARKMACGKSSRSHPAGSPSCPPPERREIKQTKENQKLSVHWREVIWFFSRSWKFQSDQQPNQKEEDRTPMQLPAQKMRRLSNASWAENASRQAKRLYFSIPAGQNTSSFWNDSVYNRAVRKRRLNAIWKIPENSLIFGHVKGEKRGGKRTDNFVDAIEKIVL